MATEYISPTQEEPYNRLMAITMLLYCVWLYEKGHVGPRLCLAIINPVPLIGIGISNRTCFGFEVVSKSSDFGQQNTHTIIFRMILAHRVANTLGNIGRSGSTRDSVSSILTPADKNTTDTVKLK